MACCGDVPTLETLAAVSIMREHLPDLKIRVVNVVDLMADCCTGRLRPGWPSVKQSRAVTRLAVHVSTACQTQSHDQRRPAQEEFCPARRRMPGAVSSETRRPAPQGLLKVNTHPAGRDGLAGRNVLQVMAHVRPTRGHTVWMRSGEAAARGIRYPAQPGIIAASTTIATTLLNIFGLATSRGKDCRFFGLFGFRPTRSEILRNSGRDSSRPPGLDSNGGGRPGEGALRLTARQIAGVDESDGTGMLAGARKTRWPMCSPSNRNPRSGRWRA